MRRGLVITVCSICVSAVLCWALAEAALTLRAWRTVPDDLLAEVAAARTDALAEISAARESVAVQVALARRDLALEIDRAVARLDARAGEITAQAATVAASAAGALAEGQLAVAEARGLIIDARAMQADYVRRIDYWTDCDRNGLCWQGALTDTLLAVRQAALEARRAAPAIVSAVESSARSVELTAQASAQTAQQIAIITRPAPRWARWAGIGLGIVAPAAQVAIAAGAVGR